MRSKNLYYKCQDNTEQYGYDICHEVDICTLPGNEEYVVIMNWCQEIMVWETVDQEKHDSNEKKMKKWHSFKY